MSIFPSQMQTILATIVIINTPSIAIIVIINIPNIVIIVLVNQVVDPLVDFFPGYLLAKCAFLVW